MQLRSHTKKDERINNFWTQTLFSIFNGRLPAWDLEMYTFDCIGLWSSHLGNEASPSWPRRMAFSCIILSLHTIDPFLRPENTLVFFTKFVFERMAKFPNWQTLYWKDTTGLVTYAIKNVLMPFEYFPLVGQKRLSRFKKSVPDWKDANNDRSIPTRVLWAFVFLFSPLHLY